MTPLLELRGMRAGYDGVAVLHGVDLSVAAGQVVALLGPNGAGKTTTLRVAAGVHPLSAGRLVEVGRALAARPRFLLLDEPAAGQDSEETRRFAALLRSLADDGTVVLLVEHDMSLVMGVCDEVHVLDLGKIISVGPPAVIRQDETVLAAYLGDP